MQRRAALLSLLLAPILEAQQKWPPNVAPPEEMGLSFDRVKRITFTHGARKVTLSVEEAFDILEGKPGPGRPV